jgi:hypothetical protein
MTQQIDDWAATMQALAEGEEPELPAPEWYTLETPTGGLDWTLVRAGDSASGKRLLVVELDDDAEARVLDALEVLAGRT